MEPIRFRCPSCNQALRVSGEKAGGRVRCTRCHEPVTVPGAEAPTPAVKKETAPVETATAHEGQTEVERGPGRRAKPRRSQKWRLARLGILVLAVVTGLELAKGFFGQVSGFLSLLSVANPAAIQRQVEAEFQKRQEEFRGLRTPEQIQQRLAEEKQRQAEVLEKEKRLALRSLWWGIGFSAVLLLAKGAGFALCACAPGESGARPLAAIALAVTVLSGGPALYLEVLSHSHQRRSIELMYDLIDANTSAADPQARLKAVTERAEQAQEVYNEMAPHMRRMEVFQIVNSLLFGVLVFVVPLMLRAFCQALRLAELEASCDVLLKLGAAVIGVSLLIRLMSRLIGYGAFGLFGLILGLTGLVSLAWSAWFLVLLCQLWKAMPARRS